MANRTPVDRGIARARVTPVASPVDTFVQNTDAGHSLNQLAEALGSVAPQLAQYSDVKAKQQSEADRAAGEQSARELAASGKSYRDAIKEGRISPQESPWFQLGAREQFGRVAAGKYSGDLQKELNANPAMNETTDVAEYDKFVEGFKKDWLDKNVGNENRNLHFERGFGQMSDAMGVDNRNKWINEAGQRLVAQQGDNQYSELFTHVDHELGLNTNHDAIADGINILQDRALHFGMDPRVANAAAVKAIGDIVMRDGDVSLFEILKKVKTGNGNNLYSQRTAQEEIQRVTQNVYADKQRKHTADQQEQKEQREAAADKVSGEVLTDLLGAPNPSRVNIQPRLLALSQMGAEGQLAAKQLTQFQSAASVAHFASNEKAVVKAQADIFAVTDKSSPDYVNKDTLIGLMVGGEINRDDFVSLKAQMDKRDAEDERAKKDASKKANAFGDPGFRNRMATIAKPGFISEGSQYDKSNTIERVKSAQAEFSRSYMEYLDSDRGQQASPVERNKFLNDLLDQVAENWRTEEAKTGSNEVGKKADLRSPTEKRQAASLLLRIDSEVRAGNGFSQPVKDYLRANNVTGAQLPQWLAAQHSYLDVPFDLNAFTAGKPQPSLPKPKTELKPAPVASDAARTKTP